MNKPFCLIISGSSGSGKTATAKKLWKSIDGNPAYLNLDSIKHFLQGAKSNDYFLDLARINALSLTRNYLKAEHSVIVDKAFGSYDYVRPFIDLANEKGIPDYYFKLVAPLETLIERVEKRRNYSLQQKILAGEWPCPSGDRKSARRIYEFFKRHNHTQGIEIDTSKNSIEEVVKIIRNHIRV